MKYDATFHDVEQIITLSTVLFYFAYQKNCWQLSFSNFSDPRRAWIQTFCILFKISSKNQCDRYGQLYMLCNQSNDWREAIRWSKVIYGLRSEWRYSSGLQNYRVDHKFGNALFWWLRISCWKERKIECIFHLSIISFCSFHHLTLKKIRK